MADNTKEIIAGFTCIAEHLQIGVAITDMDGLVVYANDADCRFLGYSKEELQNMHFSAFTHPDDVAIDANLFRELLNGQRQSYLIDKRYIKKDGSVVWGHLGVSLLLGEKDTPSFVLVSCEDITERKQLEQKLKAENTKRRKIFDRAPVSIWEEDFSAVGDWLASLRRRGIEDLDVFFQAEPEALAHALSLVRLVDVNDTTLRMFEVGSKDELLDLWSTLFTDETFQVFAEELRAIWEGRNEVDFECAAQTARGRQINYLLHWTAPLEDGQLNLHRVIVALIDITERKKTEKDLRENEEKFRTLFENMAQGVFYQKADGKLIEVNRSALEMFGLNEEQFLGRDSFDSAWKVISEDGSDLPPDKHPSMIALKTGKPVHNRVAGVFNPIKNSYVWLNINALPQFKEGEQEPYQVFVTLHDITELKLAEESLRENERAFHNLFNNTEVAMFRTRLDGSEVLDANEKFLEILGRSREEVIGRPSAILWVDSSQREKMVRLLKDQGRIVDFPFQVLSKNGEARDCLTSLNLYPEEGILDGSFLDITDRKRAEREKASLQEQLSQAQKLEALGTLAGGIAHDFNNILFALLGNAEFAKDEIPEWSPAREYIDQTIKAGNRAKELVQQILLFSRKGLGEKQPLQPAAIIKEVLKLVRASFPSSIRIKEEVDPDSGVILANPTQIHQVLMNLCTNALHAMEEEKGELMVQLSRVEVQDADLVGIQNVAGGTFVKLTIKDSGCGMDKATLERIFDPYFTTKKTGKGSGIGLAVVHGIVHDCGGFTRVESKPGKGTEFNIYLPVVEEEVQIPEEKKESLPGGDERLLIVDDEESIADLYQETFQRLGYQATAYGSSLETLAAFQSAPDDFDLIITDQTMPGLSGSELAARILKIRPDIPVILCTGFSSIISPEKAKEIGVERLIMKPVSRKDLAVTVREVLDGRQSQD